MEFPKATYFVKNENTLGFVYEAEQPNSFNVLAGKLQQDGDDWRAGFVALSPLDVLRPATQADFDAFRVSSVGHLPPA